MDIKKLPSGEATRDMYVLEVNYHDMKSGIMDFLDHVIGLSAILVASNQMAPGVRIDPIAPKTDDPIFQQYLDVIQKAGKFEMKQGYPYLLTVHPKSRYDNNETVLVFHVIEMERETGYYDRNSRHTEFCISINAEEVFQTHFKREYEAMIQEIRENQGEEEAKLKRMLTSSHWQTALRSFVTEIDIYTPILIQPH